LEEWVTVEEAIGDLAGCLGCHRQQPENPNSTARSDWRGRDEPAQVVDCGGDHMIKHRPQGENNGTSEAVWRDGDEPAHTMKGQGTAKVRFKLTDQINEAHQREGRRPMQERTEPCNTIRGGTPPLKVPNQEDTGLSDFTSVYPNFKTAHTGLDVDSPAPVITAKLTNAPYHYNHDPRESTDSEPMDWESEEPAETLSADARLPNKKRAPGDKSSMWDGARRLTVRECARLQSFPDWFVFTGTKTSQYAQVGNAVPPLLQSHIAAHLRSEVRR